MFSLFFLKPWRLPHRSYTFWTFKCKEFRSWEKNTALNSRTASTGKAVSLTSTLECSCCCLSSSLPSAHKKKKHPPMKNRRGLSVRRAQTEWQQLLLLLLLFFGDIRHVGDCLWMQQHPVAIKFLCLARRGSCWSSVSLQRFSRRRSRSHESAGTCECSAGTREPSVLVQRKTQKHEKETQFCTDAGTPVRICSPFVLMRCSEQLEQARGLFKFLDGRGPWELVKIRHPQHTHTHTLGATIRHLAHTHAHKHTHRVMIRHHSQKTSQTDASETRNR